MDAVDVLAIIINGPVLGWILIVAWLRSRERRRRWRRGLCAVCGYDPRGNVSGVCPECGTPVERK